MQSKLWGDLMFKEHLKKVKAWNANFEEVYEDVIDTYKFFRERRIEPGPAAGRTLYELGEDINEYPELLFVAYIILNALICEEEQKDFELINHHVNLMLSIYKSNQELIGTMYDELNDQNAEIISNKLKVVLRNSNEYSSKSILDAIKLF